MGCSLNIQSLVDTDQVKINLLCFWSYLCVIRLIHTLLATLCSQRNINGFLEEKYKKEFQEAREG